MQYEEDDFCKEQESSSFWKIGMDLLAYIIVFS